MELPQKPKPSHTSTVLLVIIVIGSLLAGGLLGYFVGYSAPPEEIDNLQEQVTALKEQIQNTPTTSEVTIPYSQLYEQIENLQNQVTAIQEQISSLEVEQDITEVENLQNKLISKLILF